MRVRRGARSGASRTAPLAPSSSTAARGRSATDGAGGGSFTAGAVRGLLAAFERLGYDAPSLLAAAGLRAGELEDPDAPIPCRTAGGLFAAAQRTRPEPHLSLRLAEATPFGAYPLLDYLIATAGTVGEGLRRHAQYFRLVGSPIHIGLHEDERPLRVVVDFPEGDAEYTVALSLLHLHRETGGALRAQRVSFTHPLPDPSAFEAALGCPVSGSGSWSGFTLSAAAWRLPLRRSDPALQGLLERQAQEALARLPEADDVVGALHRALARRVAGGDTRLAAVARDLGTSARTLQRRLAAASVSYQESLDRSRCEAAERHLRDTTLSIAEVSWLMGYSEPSAFHRAFKRWSGVSPQAFRRGGPPATSR